MVHYDLPWNPNRLEQREGRVDRFGQPRTQVRTLLLYGSNNEVDRVVLDVLIRKWRTIRKSLGVAVPIRAEAEQVVQAVVDNVLLRGSAKGVQLDLAFTAPEVSRLHGEWDAAAERERQHRCYFGQHGIKPDEVAREIAATDGVLGDRETVRRFLGQALQRLNGALRSSGKSGVFTLIAGDLERKMAGLAGNGVPPRVTFDRRADDERAVCLGRTHPLVALVCDGVLADAFAPAPARFSRAGAMATDTVRERTVLLLLRFRYLLREQVDEFAEEVVLTGFVRRDNKLCWLEPKDKAARHLADRAVPTANLPDADKRQHLRWALQFLKSDHGWFAPLRDWRVGELQAAHTRLRKLTKAPKLVIEPRMPPDTPSLSRRERERAEHHPSLSRWERGARSAGEGGGDEHDDARLATAAEKADPAFQPMPRYWVAEREVLARTARAPKEIVRPWLAGDVSGLCEALAMWFEGARERGQLTVVPAPAKALIERYYRREVQQLALRLAEAYPLTDADLDRLGSDDEVLAFSDRLIRSRSPRWLMGWRDITNATNERTVIASAIPMAAVGDKFLLMFSPQSPDLLLALIAGLCSIPADFVARQKIGGTYLKYFTMKQIAVPSPDTFSSSELAFVRPRVLELTYTAEDMRPLAEDLGYDGPPFPWVPDRRALLKAELDAYYAYLYQLSRDELRYILDPADVYGPDYPSETFRVLKEKETREFGEYRTRRLVLEAYDRFAADGTFDPAPLWDARSSETVRVAATEAQHADRARPAPAGRRAR